MKDKKKKLDVGDIDKLLSKVFNPVSDEKLDEAQERSWKRLQARMAQDPRDLSLRSLYGDGWSVGPLTDIEYQVLSAVPVAGSEPRDPGVIARAAQAWNPNLFLGMVYTTLLQLEKKGFVTAQPGASADQRLYEATGEGDRALRRAKEEGKVLSPAREEGDARDGLGEKPKP